MIFFHRFSLRMNILQKVEFSSAKKRLALRAVTNLQNAKKYGGLAIRQSRIFFIERSFTVEERLMKPIQNFQGSRRTQNIHHFDLKG